MNEEHLISQCINGERERDCDYCPASPSRNGGCCFGLRHEYGDPDCRACELENQCSRITHGPAPRDAQTSSRIIYPKRRVANSGRTYRSGTRPKTNTSASDYNDPGPQPGEPLIVEKPFEPQPVQFNPKDKLAVRFLKVSAWGAGEGFFEMGLNFFRKRRPE